MTLELPDEITASPNFSKRDLLIEIACIVFKHGNISAGAAAKIAGLSRMDFYGELKNRQISWIGEDASLQKEFDEIITHP